MEVATLAYGEYPITKCPVLLLGMEGDEPGECGQPLIVKVYREVVGDDFGDWANYDVGFACGHSFETMRKSLEHRAYI